MEKQDGMLSNVRQEDLKLLKENPENFWKRVNEIGPSAFDGLDSLESIEIPNTVTRIGIGAFESCKNLKSITIPESVEEISYAAFAGCKSLTKVNLPESLCEIHFATFSDCESLTDIQIPKSVRMIESAAFQGCKNLKSITFPEYMSQIERAAFENCTSLTKVNLPERVKEIGTNAFEGCSKLKEIDIPAGVRRIEEAAFDKNTTIKVPKTLDKKLIERLQKEYGDKVVIKTAKQETIAEVENQIKGESMERGIKVNTPDDLLEEIKSEANIKSDSVSEPVEETAQPEVSVAEDVSAEVVETPIVTNSPENPELQENVVNPVIEEPVEVVEEPVEVAEVNAVEETAQPEVVNANEDGAEIEMPTEAKEENDLGKIFEKSGKEFTDGLIKFLGGFKNSKHEYNAILNAVGTWLAVEKTDAKAIAINETIMSFPKVAGVKIRDEIKAGIEDALLETKDLNEVGNGLNAWYVMDGADGIKSAKNVVLRVEEIKNKEGIKEGLKNALTGYQFAYANAEEKEESEPRKIIKLHLSEIPGKEVLERLNPGKVEDRIQMLEKATRARQKSEELRHEAIEKASVTITSGVINTGCDAPIKQPVVHWREVEHKTIEEQLNAVVETTKEIIEKEQTDSNLKAAADRYIKQEEKTIKLIAQAVYSSFRAEDLVAQKVESGYPVLNAQSVLEKATEELNKMVKSGAIKEKQAQEAFDLLYKAPLIGNAVLKAALYEGGAVIDGVKEVKLKKGETLYKWVPNGNQPVQEGVVANPNIEWDSGVEIVEGEQILNVTGFEDEVKNAFRNGVSLSQFKEQKNLSEEELLSKKDVLFKQGKAYALELTRTIADATSVEEVEEIVNKVESFCADFKLCWVKDQSTVYCEAKARETFGPEASM